MIFFFFFPSHLKGGGKVKLISMVRIIKWILHEMTIVHLIKIKAGGGGKVRETSQLGS